jgi:hypothetical protein
VRAITTFFPMEDGRQLEQQGLADMAERGTDAKIIK